MVTARLGEPSFVRYPWKRSPVLRSKTGSAGAVTLRRGSRCCSSRSSVIVKRLVARYLAPFRSHSAPTAPGVMPDVSSHPCFSPDAGDTLEVAKHPELEQAARLLLEIAGEHIEMSRTGPAKYYTVPRPITLDDCLKHLRSASPSGGHDPRSGV